MDVLCAAPVCSPGRWTMVLLLLTLSFQRHLSSLLDCPSTCTCSPVEIYCNRSESSTVFPLLTFPSSSGNANGSGPMEELLQNITSM